MSARGKERGGHDFELNLTPVIDCFVTLICFLLLSATYVNLVGMEAKVPVAVPASAATEVKEPKFKLELRVKTTGMELLASGAGPASGRRWIPLLKDKKQDLTTLHAELLKVKNERPKEFSIHFTSQTDMPYEELVHFMDATRNLDAKDGTFATPVKVDVLFPDFVIADLAALPPAGRTGGKP